MTTVIIPARYGASRFPGKLAHTLQGVPVINRTAAITRAHFQTYIATDSVELACLRNVPVLLTSMGCRNGTERVAEAARCLKLPADEVIINLQGDSPLMPLAAVQQLAGLMTEGVEMATLVGSQCPGADRNTVRAEIDYGLAMDFHREDTGGWRHYGIYAYRNDVLQGIAAATPCRRELEEGLEQLRARSLGVRIRAGLFLSPVGPEINVPGDIALAEAWMTQHPEGRWSEVLQGWP